MPIREYECPKCHKVIERIEFNDIAPAIKCSFCGNIVERIMSSTTFILKGNGWEKDGYSLRTNN